MSNSIRRITVLLLVALVAVACNSSTTTPTTTAPDPEPVAAEPTATTEPEPEPTATPEPEPTATPVPETDDSEEPATDDTDGADEIEAPEDDTTPAASVDWRPCGSLECGSVEVPLDYDDPSEGTIDVAINVHRATDPENAVGYLLVNPGGPGIAGTELVEFADFSFDEELLERFDIIGFDPRGTGGTPPAFACGVGPEQFETLLGIEEYPDTPEEVAIGNSAAELCVESMGPIAVRMGTMDVVRDMDEIRKALGVEQISYLGFSYGSTLGGWYASMFPDRVYSMVVDGAANPLLDADDLETALEIARADIGPINQQFSEALASCDDVDCPIWNNGDPEGFWYDNAQKMELVVAARNGNNDAAYLGLVGHFYSETQWPILHQSIYDLGANDDPSGFLAAIEVAGVVDEASIIAHINCLDAWALFPDDTLEGIVAESKEIDDDLEAILSEEFPLLYAFDLPDQARACPHYGAIGAPAFEGTYDGGGVPILVVGNTSDPITPFVQSEQFANEVLNNGRLITVEHPQHVAYPANPCVVDFVHAALIDREYPDDEPDCGATEPVDFLSEITLVEDTLEDGSTVVVPTDWLELQPGLYAPTASALDPILVFYIPTFGDSEGTFDFLRTQIPAELELVFDDIPAGGGVWDLYTGDVPAEGTVVRIAVRAEPGGVIILGQAAPDDIERLTELVLNPSLEGYQPG